jgi:hypothetical protein
LDIPLAKNEYEERKTGVQRRLHSSDLGDHLTSAVYGPLSNCFVRAHKNLEAHEPVFNISWVVARLTAGNDRTHGHGVIRLGLSGTRVDSKNSHIVLDFIFMDFGILE